jgi:predicted nucleic acid-binding protein
MSDKIFFDTNILIYLANEDSPFHLEVAKTFKEIARKSELWISRQVLREYAVVMTRHGIVEKPLSSKEIVSDMEKWGSLFQVADETEEVTNILVELIKTYNIKGKSIHDANIIAVMTANSIQTLFTLNIKDFKKFKKIQLITM